MWSSRHSGSFCTPGGESSTQRLWTSDVWMAVVVRRKLWEMGGEGEAS